MLLGETGKYSSRLATLSITCFSPSTCVDFSARSPLEYAVFPRVKRTSTNACFFKIHLQVFRIITSNFADVDPGLLASLHDTPWTMIKLAHTARKQGLTEVCLNSLSKLYSVATMDVQVRSVMRLV